MPSIQLTKKQMLDFLRSGGILKYDDKYYLRWCDEEFEVQTSLDGIYWAPGFIALDPPTDHSLFRIIRV